MNRKDALIRSGTIIYPNVTFGKKFRTGHNVLIRDNTIIGNNVLVGTNTVIEGDVQIGNNVSIQSNVYIPKNTRIGDNVFIAPCVVFTNDKYPIRKKYELRGATVRNGVSIGANATILPDVEISEGAMVAAGAVVTKDVPPWKLAVGNPAIVTDLPKGTRKLNRI